MNRSVYFIVFAALVAIARSGANLDNNLGSSVQIVEDINEFISKNPEVVLTPLQRQYGSRRYVFGYSDHNQTVLAEEYNYFSNTEPQDMQLKLWYPRSESEGNADLVWFVDIWVDQSSNIGNAYIIEGRIGEFNIKILIEAKETRYFNYRATFYGW